MSAELDFTTGDAGIAITYDGETPWHGYGNRVKGNDLDEWRVAAGLDWEVVDKPIYFKAGTTDFPIYDKKVLLRDDNFGQLSVVGSDYQVVQPKEIMEFYRDLISDNGFEMETAGSLMQGRRIWALASVGATTRIFGQDKIDGYLLLATSYDGRMATTAKFTSVRVVCNNTLEWANYDTSYKNAVKIHHSTTFDPEVVKGRLGFNKEAWEAYEANLNKLANRTVDLETAVAFFTKVLGSDSVKHDKEGKVNYSPTFMKVFTAYENGPGSHLKSASHTAWGLVNAVTFYQDHMVKGNDQGSRLNNAWFGQGNERKNKAWEEALKIAA